MKVLIADKFEQVGLNGLKGLGVEIDYQPDLKDEALNEAIKSSKANILIVRSTKVNAKMMEDSHLALIIRAGAGYNTIDLNAANHNSIYVANCPGKNSFAVAELAMGLILAVDRKIPHNFASLKEGKWNKKEYSKSKGIYGRTLGIVGFGQIAQEVANRAKAFGMKVNVFSRWMTPQVAKAVGVERVDSLKELAETSDVVSVHVSLRPETKEMINGEFFQNMKEGAYFINTSRGEVVDQNALGKVLEQGKIYAGLDVFQGEPASGQADYDGPIKDWPNLYITHHIGASTAQAQEAIAYEVIRMIKNFLQNGIVPNLVNQSREQLASSLLVVRHLDKVGVLATVFDALRDANINVQEVENIVLAGGHAAIAQVALNKKPNQNVIDAIQQNKYVLDVNVFEMQSETTAVAI